jgi:mannose-6-phosphate isomerase-like protein (cupin superfamily)
MTFEHTPGHNKGTPTPGANPDGYMLGPDEGSMTWFEKALITFKAKDADTRGIVSFFQCDVPYGWQAPVHKHANEAELFFITEGEWEIFVNDTVHDAGPGCTVWIPPATPHSIFVRSKRGRGYAFVTPAGFEKFFEDMGEPATVASMPTHETRTPTVDELLEAGKDLGWELVEPEPRRLHHHDHD